MRRTALDTHSVKFMTSIPLVRQVAIAPAMDYLDDLGVPVSVYLKRSRLMRPNENALEMLIPLHQVCVFLSDVARSEGIDDLGFRIGGQLGVESLGLYGRLTAQAFTLHELIDTSLAMVRSFNSGLRIWVERHQDQVRYCQKYAEHLPQDRTTEIVHLGIANALASARYGQGDLWQPNRIEVASGPVNLSDHFSGLADLPIAFNQPFTSIWVDRKLLSKPLPELELTLGDEGDDQAKSALLESAPATSVPGQLEQAIESALVHPDMSLPHMAAIVGISARTMQRQLAQRYTSFSRVVQTVRFRMAHRLLKDRDLPISEIAIQLGYSNPENFTRAFRSWTGVSASDFRDIHLNDME